MKNKECGKLAAKYLTVGLDSGKAELFQEAFGDVVESQGIKTITKKPKMPVHLLKKTLADRAVFQRWVDIAIMVKALGGNRMEFKPNK